MLDSADNETADVAFRVGANEDEKTMYAHSIVLRARAPSLAELAEEYDRNTPIPLDDVDPDVFGQLLRFVYGGEVPDKAVLATSLALLTDSVSQD